MIEVKTLNSSILSFKKLFVVNYGVMLWIRYLNNLRNVQRQNNLNNRGKNLVAVANQTSKGYLCFRVNAKIDTVNARDFVNVFLSE